MSTPPAAPDEGRFDLLRWTLLLLAPLVLVPVLGPFALPAWLPWLGYSLHALHALYAWWHRPRLPRRDLPTSLELDGSGSLRVNGTVRR